MNENEKLYILSCKEISLKTHLDYCTNKDLLIGLKGYSDGEKTNLLATSAIVFMTRGICGNWKQPLAYFLVNEACSSDKVKESWMCKDCFQKEKEKKVLDETLT